MKDGSGQGPRVAVNMHPTVAGAHTDKAGNVAKSLELARLGEQLLLVARDAHNDATHKNIVERSSLARKVHEALDGNQRGLLDVVEEVLYKGGRRHRDLGQSKQSQGLDQTRGLALRRLTGAHDTPLALVELSRLRLLAIAIETGVEASQLREGSGARVPVQWLRDAHHAAARLQDAPVAGGQRVAQRGGELFDFTKVNNVLKVDAGSRYLAEMQGHLVEHAAHELAEEHGQ